MNPFYAQIYDTIEKHVYKYGFSVVVSSKCSIKTVNQRGYDGVIIAQQDDELIKSLKKSSIPYVVINYTSTQRDIVEVNIDIDDGIKEVADILKRYGHYNIGYITKFTDDKRFSVFKKNLNSSCILTKSIVSEGNDDYDMGYEAAKKLNLKKKDITAIFAFNDCMAMGAMNAYMELGKRIPEDISIIGFDNIVQSKYTNPPLTSISIPVKKIGQKAAEMLMMILDGKKTKSICLNTELCIRKSVDKTSARKAE